MGFLRKSALIGLTVLALGCSPKYEEIYLEDIIRYPVQYIGKNIEVQGKTLNINNGELCIGDYYNSLGIKTDCSRKKDKKRAERLHDIIFDEAKTTYADRIVLKGKFNGNKILEVKEGFFEKDNKKYKF